MPFEKESIFFIDSGMMAGNVKRRSCEKFPRQSPYARAYRLRHLRSLCSLDASSYDLRGNGGIQPLPRDNHRPEGAVDDRVLDFVAENLDVGFGLVGWFEFLLFCLALIQDVLLEAQF